jgi:hypothetical protein
MTRADKSRVYQGINNPGRDIGKGLTTHRTIAHLSSSAFLLARARRISLLVSVSFERGFRLAFLHTDGEHRVHDGLTGGTGNGTIDFRAIGDGAQSDARNPGKETKYIGWCTEANVKLELSATAAHR